MTSSSVVWSVMAPFAMMALGSAPQVDAQDPLPPTAIEEALIERACSMLPSASFADSDAHTRCRNAQLQQLRSDFGRDLRRLSNGERTALDSACGRLSTTHGREAYLDCLNAQLVALRTRRTRATRAQASTATPAAEASAASAAAPSAPAPSPGSSLTALIAGGALLLIGAIAAATLVVARRRRGRRSCRECGAALPNSGDLCATCRHAAAEALRRVATERLAEERAADEEQRRQRALEEEQRRQAALQQEEEARREEEQRRQRAEDARRKQEEDALGRSRTSAAAPRAQEEFDPYAVLGVPRDTSPESIRAAYEQARLKYNEDTVAHLGIDVQEHFRAKAEAVDRAYQMLAG